MNRENLNQNNLDFEKINATLANPDFANWYYNQVINDTNENVDFSIEDFIQKINNYNLN